jgi:hypothetical protein
VKSSLLIQYIHIVDYDHVVAWIRKKIHSSVARPVPGWNSIRIPSSIDSCAPVVITTHWDRKMEPLQTCHFGICSESYFQEETIIFTYTFTIHSWMIRIHQDVKIVSAHPSFQVHSTSFASCDLKSVNVSSVSSGTVYMGYSIMASFLPCG